MKNVLRKMRCRSRKDLIRWVSAKNVEFTFTVDDLEIGVVTEPAESPAPAGSSLTADESDILTRLKRGESHRDIALGRGSSARTVANQVAYVLRKTGATSRFDLMAMGLRGGGQASLED